MVRTNVCVSKETVTLLKRLKENKWQSLEAVILKLVKINEDALLACASDEERIVRGNNGKTNM